MADRQGSAPPGVRNSVLRSMLIVAATAAALAGCGDVETWEMTASQDFAGNNIIKKEYTFSEEACRKLGQVALHNYGGFYTCRLVAFQEDFPGGETGARLLRWVVEELLT